jgi:hypothetical protein
MSSRDLALYIGDALTVASHIALGRTRIYTGEWLQHIGVCAVRQLIQLHNMATLEIPCVDTVAQKSDIINTLR